MADLRGKHIKEGYKFLLSLSAATSSRVSLGIETNLRTITDGEGAKSALRISTTQVNTTGDLIVSGRTIIYGGTGQTSPSIEFGNKTDSGALGIYSVPSFNNNNLGDSIRFTVNDIAAADIEKAGTDANFTRTIMTREKGDFRYIQKTDTAFLSNVLAGVALLSAENIFTESQQIRANSPSIKLIEMDQPDTDNALWIVQAGGLLYLQKRNQSGLTVNSTIAIFEERGNSINNAASVVTREKGDNRYWQMGAELYSPNAFTITTPNQTADAKIEIGTGRTSNGNAFIDLVSDTINTDYGTRLIREPGNNGVTTLTHRGGGALHFITEDNRDILFFRSNVPGEEVAAISPGGASSPLPITIITAEKGDHRYVRLSAVSRITANELQIQGNSPRLTLIDSSNAENDTFWVYNNENRFFILTDRDGNLAWETPHPFELRNSEEAGYIYGKRVIDQTYGDLRYALKSEIPVSPTPPTPSTPATPTDLYDSIVLASRSISLGNIVKGQIYDGVELQPVGFQDVRAPNFEGVTDGIRLTGGNTPRLTGQWRALSNVTRTADDSDFGSSVLISLFVKVGATTGGSSDASSQILTTNSTLGGIGSYAFLYSVSNSNIAPGTTMGGENLRYAGVYNYIGDWVQGQSEVSQPDSGAFNYDNNTVPGIWRAMGGASYLFNNPRAIARSATLFVRIQ